MTLDDAWAFLSIAGPIALIVGASIALFQLGDLRGLRQMEVITRLFDRGVDETFQTPIPAPGAMDLPQPCGF